MSALKAEFSLEEFFASVPYAKIKEMQEINLEADRAGKMLKELQRPAVLGGLTKSLPLIPTEGGLLLSLAEHDTT